MADQGDNFITWHIRQLMDDPDEAKAKFYKHVAERKEAADHVLTQWAQPIKTDGYWRQPENNGHTMRARVQPSVNIYENVAANLEKLEKA